jgi:hypothetical protein
MTISCNLSGRVTTVLSAPTKFNVEVTISGRTLGRRDGIGHREGAGEGGSFTNRVGIGNLEGRGVGNALGRRVGFADNEGFGVGGISEGINDGASQM